VIVQVTYRGVAVIGKIELYSPNQVYVGAFFGGPLAMIFMLKKNFDAMKNEAASRRAVFIGVLFIALLFALLPFLPGKIPSYLLPIVYSAAGRGIAEHQMSKQAIRDSEQFGFRTGWNVAGVAFGFFMLFLVLFVLWVIGLQALGLLNR
jgi:hypothetical protein